MLLRWSMVKSQQRFTFDSIDLAIGAVNRIPFLYYTSKQDDALKKRLDCLLMHLSISLRTLKEWFRY